MADEPDAEELVAESVDAEEFESEEPDAPVRALVFEPEVSLPDWLLDDDVDCAVPPLALEVVPLDVGATLALDCVVIAVVVELDDTAEDVVAVLESLRPVSVSVVDESTLGSLQLEAANKTLPDSTRLTLTKVDVGIGLDQRRSGCVRHNGALQPLRPCSARTSDDLALGDDVFSSGPIRAKAGSGRPRSRRPWATSSFDVG